MVWADSEFAVPTSSFNSPVPLVLDDPRTGELVRVCFNKHWLRYIAGSLMQLVLQTTWDTTDPDALFAMQGRAFDLISLFNAATVEDCDAPNAAGFAGAGGGDDFLLRQNPTNPCLLESSVDGVTWCTWADLSKCLGNPPQPGNGTPSPAPGGGCVNLSGILFGNGRYLIPPLLSDTDTVQITFVEGAVSDSLQWYCSNGNVFFDGDCIPLVPPFVGTDPLPSAPHLSILLHIGSDYFPIGTSGIVTITGGHTNEPAELICNTITPGAVAGNFQFELEVCNNTPVPGDFVVTVDQGSGSTTVHPGSMATFTSDALTNPTLIFHTDRTAKVTVIIDNITVLCAGSCVYATMEHPVGTYSATLTSPASPHLTDFPPATLLDRFLAEAGNGSTQFSVSIKFDNP